MFLAELAKTGEALEAAERRTLVEFDRAATAGQHLHEEQTKHWKTELEQLSLIADQTQDILNAFQESVSSIVSRSVDDIRHRLKAIIERFTEEQLAQLLQAFHQEHGARVWRCNAAPLRDSLESEFLRIYRHAETRIFEVETVVRKHFAGQYRLFDESVELGQPSAPARAPSPPMMPIASPVALDLDYPWWSAWWQGRPTPDNRQRAFRRLVEADFGPLAEQLTSSAEEHLNKQAHTMVRQISAAKLQVHNSVRRRSSNLMAKLETQERPADVKRKLKVTDGVDRQAKFRAIRQRLADIALATKQARGTY